MKRLVYLLLLALTPPSFGQSLKDYGANLEQLRASLQSWRSFFNGIDPSKLALSPESGNRIDRERNGVLIGIRLVDTHLSDIPKVSRILSSQIELLILIKNLQRDMNDLSFELSETASGKPKLVESLALEVVNVANIQLGAYERYQETAVRNSADELQRRCAKP